MVLAPAVFAVLSFGAGVILLWSLALPSLPEEVARLVPVVRVNASHFFSSLAGVLLLLVAAGLRRRSRSAWTLAFGLLIVSTVLNATRSGSLVESAVLAILAAALWLSRGAFYRPGGLRRALHERGWFLAAIAAFATFVWLGFVFFEDVPYSDELWWRFVLEDGGASRFLRGAAGGAILLAGVIAWRLLAPAPLEEAPPPLDEDRILRVLDRASFGRCDANLVWLRDKHLFWSESGETFLQYGVRGRRLIVMGEPCGRENDILPTLRGFRDFADRHGMELCFYSVGRDLLPGLVELGLIIQKIGEAALVPLPSFSLEGSARKPLRQIKRRVEREGFTFRIAPIDEVPALLPKLRPISDAWLARHEGEEKGFSLGSFDEAYLSRFPVALVEGADGPVAFANVWTTTSRRELSVDLMRYAEATPRGVMDYLFTELAFWGKENGYGVLDLGMAPLSGLEEDRLAPLLSQVGAFAYEHGGRFYGFQGLRMYKDKFDPVWEPLYLAAASRLGLPFALADVALMTSGGVRGVIRRPRSASGSAGS
ncbi:phosphatidylglycerol lysyltransferase domain-containing protein [Parvularcula dongshanensis]|uniref:Lysylphosphatidylglycerol synthetase-like protein (DUF2156 family) n=1 Tax=Parvularcula dongshanensis TaxID=1173995 RepID=A0A840I3K6_9PROT|nr:phosphatidylglycerol lysyltransferase domain-containing protein [Parvularcula dongshanensis]MBB4659586.1 lysylphosphatidylglycerol synthetase-like protein (DUF2156 family) [Parvularcula dongshanensis]